MHLFKTIDHNRLARTGARSQFVLCRMNKYPPEHATATSANYSLNDKIWPHHVRQFSNSIHPTPPGGRRLSYIFSFIFYSKQNGCAFSLPFVQLKKFSTYTVRSKILSFIHSRRCEILGTRPLLAHFYPWYILRTCHDGHFWILN